jgi:hypothetical protein
MNRKVVDLTTLYNFQKAIGCFSQRILQERRANFECRHVLENREFCLARGFSHFSTQNLKFQST